MYREAIDAATQVITNQREAGDQCAKAFYRRAQARRLNDDFEGAAGDLKAALALAPGDPLVLEEQKELRAMRVAATRAMRELAVNMLGGSSHSSSSSGGGDGRTTPKGDDASTAAEATMEVTEEESEAVLPTPTPAPTSVPSPGPLAAAWDLGVPLEPYFPSAIAL